MFILLPPIEGSEAAKIREESELRIAELRKFCAHREVGDWWSDWMKLMPMMSPRWYEIKQCQRCEMLVAARQLCIECGCVVYEASGENADDAMSFLNMVCSECKKKSPDFFKME